MTFSFVLVELALHITYAVVTRQLFPFVSYRSAIARIATGHNAHIGPDLQGGELMMGKAIEVIHPYFGFVRDPSRMPNTSYLGFPQEDDDPFTPCTNGLLVAVCGGSFAQGVSSQGRMEEALRNYGIESRVVTLAMGGYKQPQQLAILTWLLSHNTPIDVLINIDGFNEVALPQAENLPKGVNPFYPRAWYRRTQNLHDRESLRLIGRGATLESERQEWAKLFTRCVPWSISVNILWRTRDKAIEHRIAGVNTALLNSTGAGGAHFITTGPECQFPERKLYDRLASHWKQCSLLMNTLCDSRGIIYIHVLQPNQYYEAGRTLTAEEHSVAFRANHSYRPGVVNGYPRLIEQGIDLVSQGVDFHDLTFIYRDISEPIYRDDCCHPNRLGFEIVGQYLADSVAARHGQKEAEQQHPELQNGPRRRRPF